MSDTGNPLLNQPPTDVKVTDVIDHEIDPRKRAQLEALGRKDAGDHNSFWSSFWASVLDGATTVVSLFADKLDLVLAFMGRFFVAAQGEKTPHFWDFAAVILEDLTGVEVDKEELQKAAHGSGRLKAMEIFGADLYKQLESEFKPESGDLEEGDAAPAERFLGFLMNFAIRQGNVEMLTSFLPEEVRIGEGFRAYGELMAKNLGLGRLARQALKPLIATLVADPLQFKLNEQYRPKRLGPAPAIKKFFRTPDFEQQMRKELAQEGYSDERIDDLIEDSRPGLADRQLIESLFRFGDVTTHVGDGQSLGIHDRLTQRGHSAEDAQKLIDLARPTLDKGEISTLFVNEKMDQPTALGYLSKLGYDDDTAQLVLRSHSLTHNHARHLGLSELKKAFHNAVIDLLEFKAKLTAQGYADDDIQIITLDMLQPTHGKVRQLSLAEVKAGFKAGALTENQAAEHLKALGYSDTDVAVLVKTLPGPKVTAPPAAPAA